MPGYKALPSFMTGETANQVREAEAAHRDGDPAAAVVLLEEALAASLAVRPEYPGWLCGRLAALYRTLGRHDDEVHLLERYRDSQTSEEARTRYDARLSKARTIADRKRRPDSGALESVRASLGRPRHRRVRNRDTAAAAPPPCPPAVASAGIIAHLAEAAAAREPEHGPAMRAALEQLVAEGRQAALPTEALVDALRKAVASAEGLSAGTRSARYADALVHLIALSFAEPPE